LRAFVALEIPDPRILDALVGMQSQLKQTGADLKLVERQNLHFTVKFLGEISDSKASEADSRLKSLRLAGAEVEVKGVGAFPNSARPNVVWVGVAREHEGLVSSIAQPVIGALEGIGEPDRRPFEAHLTLARMRSRSGSESLTSVLRTNAERSFGVVRLTKLKLKSSNLTPRGPIYTDVGEYPLA
jgi:2'-5' RNA ligase